MLKAAGAGRSIDPENVEQLTAVLSEIASDQPALARMKQNATVAAEDFTHERQMGIITTLMERVGNEHRQAARVF